MEPEAAVRRAAFETVLRVNNLTISALAAVGTHEVIPRQVIAVGTSIGGVRLCAMVEAIRLDT